MSISSARAGNSMDDTPDLFYNHSVSKYLKWTSKLSCTSHSLENAQQVPMDLRNLIKDEMANLASESMQIDLGLYKNENLKMFFFSISKGKKLKLFRHIAKKNSEIEWNLAKKNKWPEIKSVQIWSANLDCKIDKSV